jgi:hypothetical protein
MINVKQCMKPKMKSHTLIFLIKNFSDHLNKSAQAVVLGMRLSTKNNLTPNY